jgi:hypothetical protein
VTRSHRVEILLSGGELAELRAAADGRPLAAWMRRALVDRARGEGAIARADDRVAALERRVEELEGRDHASVRAAMAVTAANMRRGD